MKNEIVWRLARLGSIWYVSIYAKDWPYMSIGKLPILIQYAYVLYLLWITM